MMDFADIAARDVMREELRDLESWLPRAEDSTSEEYTALCLRADYLRAALGQRNG